jgi:cytochrome P450
MLRPQFLGNRGQNFVEIQEHTENLLDNIPEGVALDLQPLFFRYTIDTTTFLLFGKSIFSLKAQDNTAKEIEFTDAFNKSQAYMAQRMRLGPFYWTVNGRKLKETCATVHRFVDDIVKKATSERYKMQRPEESKNYVLIESLLNETQDLKVIRYQLLHILLAGRDTTASYLAWTV